VQIQAIALGLNRAESMFRSGQYLEEPKLPARLGYEAAGTVAAIGPGVEGFQVGDAVATIPSFSLKRLRSLRRPGERPGPCRDPSSRLTLLGRGGGGLMQYLTAYGALIDIAGLTKGDSVVIPPRRAASASPPSRSRRRSEPPHRP